MFKKFNVWANEHRTWLLFLFLAIIGVLYLGYINLWEPLLMLESAKTAAGETIDFTKDIIAFFAQKDILELIKVLTPLLLPIITWKIKSRMDNDVKNTAKKTKETTNKVIREKLGLFDRRKTKRIKTDK